MTDLRKCSLCRPRQLGIAALTLLLTAGLGLSLAWADLPSSAPKPAKVEKVDYQLVRYVIDGTAFYGHILVVGLVPNGNGYEVRVNGKDDATLATDLSALTRDPSADPMPTPLRRKSHKSWFPKLSQGQWYIQLPSLRASHGDGDDGQKQYEATTIERFLRRGRIGTAKLGDGASFTLEVRAFNTIRPADGPPRRQYGPWSAPVTVVKDQFSFETLQVVPWDKAKPKLRKSLGI